jgi:hypothetical protein
MDWLDVGILVLGGVACSFLLFTGLLFGRDVESLILCNVIIFGLVLLDGSMVGVAAALCHRKEGLVDL